VTDHLPPFLHPFARPAADRFVEIVRGEGALVWDSDGREYVDALASLWYCVVGHGRTEIADAVGDQLRTLDAFHTFELFTNPAAERLAAELVAISPIEDARVFLTNSGSEAVDTAMKLSRLFWAWQGRPERSVIVSRDRAYHGVTYGGTSAQGLAPNKEHWGELLGGVVQVHADSLEDVERQLAEHGDRIAAVITEPVQGAGGVFPPADGYLEGLRDLCDRTGALLVFDEVITGFGRLGTWWGADRYGVTPDLVTFAKGVTSGYQPLGGVLVGPRVREVLEADDQRWLRHGFTYSGHPAACAAASANLSVIRSDDLLPRAPAIGDRLGPALHGMVEDGLAAGVRGTDGIWALALHPEDSALVVRDEMLELGVIPRPIATHSIAFCPPLVVTDDQLDRVVDATRTALTTVRDRSGA
jgi:adenosylmethionine-8-amino-7-oxononanoate aminotransferase